MSGGALILTVVPMLETLYSCVGATLKEEDGTLLLGLVTLPNKYRMSR